jgi:23S rRNA pseudouridine2605 synthase
MPERLQKLIANAGMGSRREVEGWIEAGRVAVNGRTASLGDKATASDRVTVDGRAVRLATAESLPCRVLMYKKHSDQIVTKKDPEGRQTVFRGLPYLKTGRWLAVGRLDINTSGLLLMTTDGELKRRLEHPSYELEREYAVRVHGAVDDAMLERLVNGVELEDGPGRFDQITVAGGKGTNQWFNVILREGRYRLVRRLWASQGVEVSRLVRVRFGPVPLPGGIKAGRYQEMTPVQVSALAQAVGLKR